MLETHKHDDPRTLARDLLAGFYDSCMRSGLDGVLHELAAVLPGYDMTDRHGLIEHASVGPAFVDAIRALDLDGGGPRNTRPRKVTETVLATLSLAPAEDADRTITLGDDVRTAVVAAMASVVDVALGVPQIRDTTIAMARAACELRYHGPFDKIAEQLDERGMKVMKQLKIPLDAVQAVQQVLVDARATRCSTASRARRSIAPRRSSRAPTPTPRRASISRSRTGSRRATPR